MDGICRSHGRDKNCKLIVDSESKWNKPLEGFKHRIILKCIFKETEQCPLAISRGNFNGYALS